MIELCRARRSEKSGVLKFDEHPEPLGDIFEGMILFLRNTLECLGAKVLPTYNAPEVPHHEA